MENMLAMCNKLNFHRDLCRIMHAFVLVGKDNPTLKCVTEKDNSS